MPDSEFDRVLITAPDRLARNYVHQVLVIEELERRGITVEILDRPMSRDPHDQLLLQIRGAVAEFVDRTRKKVRGETCMFWLFVRNHPEEDKTITGACRPTNQH